MQFKTYIAILFTVVFFGKFLMLDAKVLNSVLKSEGIAMVNPFCKKNDRQTAGDNILSQDSSVLVISSDAICNSFFFITHPEFQKKEVEDNFHAFNYLNPAIISIYFSKDYPPPKALVA
ncbi:MAG TPA: hypothetical protein VJ899_01760 [Salegentibacter sp.]|nr:hypothetical protein [Salegentibacter sp.]